MACWLAALVLGGLLWATLHDTTSNDGCSLLRRRWCPVHDHPGAAPIAPASKIVKVTTYDPEGDDGQENDDLVSRAIDGRSGDMWSTLCYGSRTLGGKGGVGIVADLGTAVNRNVLRVHRQRAVPDPDPHGRRRLDPGADRRLGRRR